MVSNLNFSTAVQFLDQLTNQREKETNIQSFRFEQYQEQHPIKTAIQVLHLAATTGTEEQRKQLYARKRQIKDLNQLLKSPELFQENLRVKLHLSDMSDISFAATADIADMQVALPQNKFQRMIETLLKIPGFALAILSDIILLPGAGLLILLELIKKDFNPKENEVKKDKTPILLLHGSGFCQAQWIAARYFLKGKEFGSVFSCSYAEGLMSNDPASSIGKYSAEKVRQQILEIQKATGQNKVIIIGHSMGSLVGEDYAQNHAKQDGIEVTNILSLSTPWQGSPTIDLLRLKAKRYQEMSVALGEKKNLEFRKNLIANAKQADIRGHRVHWNMWSKHDPAVPGKSGRLTEDPRRHYEMSGVGHFIPMIHFGMLLKMRAWVKKMYAREMAQQV